MRRIGSLGRTHNGRGRGFAPVLLVALGILLHASIAAAAPHGARSTGVVRDAAHRLAQAACHSNSLTFDRGRVVPSAGAEIDDDGAADGEALERIVPIPAPRAGAIVNPPERSSACRAGSRPLAARAPPSLLPA